MREVLCDFDGRTRPELFASSDHIKEENSNLSAIKSTLIDLLSGKVSDDSFVEIEGSKHDGLIALMGRVTPIIEGQKVCLQYWKHPEDENSQVTTSQRLKDCNFL